MLSQIFQIFKLRGMDQRWAPDPARAKIVRDLIWDPRDGWKRSGGDKGITPPTIVELQGDEDVGIEPSDDISDDPFIVDGATIDSLHWFSQHNGARQWLIWETSNGALRCLWPGGLKVENRGPYSTDASGVSIRQDGIGAGHPFRNLTRLGEDGLVVIDGDEGDSRTILKTPNIGSQSVTWADRIYIVNGYDEPIVFDGKYCSRAGYSSAPSSPVASVVKYEAASSDKFHGYWVADSGMGVGVVGSTGKKVGYGGRGRGDKYNLFRYKVSFVNKRGQESPLSAPSNQVRAMCWWEPNVHTYVTRDNVVARRFFTVQIPKGPPDTVARRVYRTQDMLDLKERARDLGMGMNYYFLHEIQDNTTTSLEDSTPDAALGALVEDEDFGPWPTNARLIAAFKNTMFISGFGDNKIKYSRPLFPEVFPLNHHIDIGNSEAGPVTGMRATKNALVVFKRKAIYLIKGDPERGFHAQTLTRDVGCICANTIAELPGLGLAFLSDSGVMLLKGALENTGTPTDVVHLSEPIPDLIKKINFSAAENARGLYYHRNREYWLTVPEFGDPQNSMVMIYHAEIGEWSIRTGFSIRTMVETRDHRGYLYYSSLSDDLPGLRVYTGGETTHYGDTAVVPTLPGPVSVQPKYASVNHDFGSKFSAFMPAYINAYAVGYGDTNMEVNFQVNRSEKYSLTIDKSAKQQEPIEPLSVWGKAKWNSATWGWHRPIVLRYDVSAMHEGVVREVSVSFSASNSMQIVGYDIEGKVGEQRNIRPLGETLTVNRR